VQSRHSCRERAPQLLGGKVIHITNSLGLTSLNVNALKVGLAHPKSDRQAII